MNATLLSHGGRATLASTALTRPSASTGGGGRGDYTVLFRRCSSCGHCNLHAAYEASDAKDLFRADSKESLETVGCRENGWSATIPAKESPAVSPEAF